MREQEVRDAREDFLKQIFVLTEILKLMDFTNFKF